MSTGAWWDPSENVNRVANYVWRTASSVWTKLTLGQQAAVDSVPVVLASDQPAIAVTGTTFDGIIKDGTGDTTQANVSTGRLHVDPSGVTSPVSAASLPLPTGASTAALQLPDGHNVTVDNASIAITAAALPLPAGAATSALQLPDSHNVTVDNAAGAAAVNIQDGGNTITVDGAVTATVASTTLTATVYPVGEDSVVDGRQVVAVAGTREQLTAQACKAVAITAETDNTGVIVIGAVTCVAAVGTRRGHPLAAGDTVIIAVDNMNRLYFDSTVSGDGITWLTLA